ncbi:hypothetical protein ACQPX6_29420 [Actinomycetospora sp. CA-101289]|uniref:hypothetical protein n=1 Tax=Actinomycetospora sp. CA-101289 TaxID=3239893 RepID=UPI003D97445B
MSAVLGRAEEDGRWYYSVDKGGETVGLESEDLQGTGRVLDRSACYPEDAPSVRVSPRGQLVDPPDGVESPVSIDFPAEHAVRDGRPWFVDDASIGTVTEFYDALDALDAQVARVEVADLAEYDDLLRRIEHDVPLPPAPPVDPDRAGGIARRPVLVVSTASTGSGRATRTWRRTCS